MDFLALLAAYDHCVVHIAGRRAVLLAQPWRAGETDAHVYLQASFAHPAGHPSVPPPFQAVVDGLTFRPWDGKESTIQPNDADNRRAPTAHLPDEFDI